MSLSYARHQAMGCLSIVGGSTYLVSDRSPVVAREVCHLIANVRGYSAGSNIWDVFLE